MLFNSLSYLFFLSVTLIVFYILSSNKKIFFLVLSSFIFYGFWEPIYLILIISITLIDYLLAQKIHLSKNITSRKLYLISSIVLNIGILLTFKYLYFFAQNIEFLGFNINPSKYSFVLPLGISFYTFEAISYVVDVYNKKYIPENKYIYYFAFISFFPKLIAGPILRAKDLIPQFKSFKLNVHNFYNGFQRIIVGLFLKVVIADNISSLVDEGYLVPNEYLNPLDIWTLAFLFGIQIYFDFSAYSSIAIGSARLFGIIIPENFNFPYLVNNPRDFWKRWHISLSTWIKDYLYVPLLRNNKQNNFNRTSILIITWCIMGFWHGANWTFILWGLLHSILILIYRVIDNFLDYKKYISLTILSHIFSISFIMLAWIPFRTSSIIDALEKYKIIFSFNNYFELGLRENIYLITFILMVGIYISSILKPLYRRFSNYYFFNLILNFLIGLLLLPIILAFLKPNNQFIYFQF